MEFERRLLACPTLPSLPAVALQVMRLCQPEEIDLWQVAQALSTDPALTAHLLRVANSASLATRGKVTTVNRAVALLGTRAVVSITLSFSLMRGRRSDDHDALDRGALWRRAAYAALAARTLAEVATTRVDPQEAFVAALLQDLGMLALAECFRGEYGRLCARAGRDHAALAVLEREVWSVDHAAASALLARFWLLPPELWRAVGSSHEPPARLGAAPGELLGGVAPQLHLGDCVALSGRIADAWLAPRGLGTALALDGAAEQLQPSLMEAVLARMALAVPEISADFEIDLGGPARVEEVLAEARLLLSEKKLALPAERRTAPAASVAPLSAAFGYAQRHAEPVALLVASLAPASPEELCRLVELCRRRLRAIDLVVAGARGEVFALLPSTGLAGARTAAGRLFARAAAELEAPLAMGLASSSPAAPAASFEVLQTAACGALAAALGRSGPEGDLTEAPPFDRT